MIEIILFAVGLMSMGLLATEFCSTTSGRAAKLYVNNGTVPVPVWVEITEARDLSLPFGAEKFDDPDRGSFFKLFDAGQIETQITGSITYRQGSVNAKTIRDLLLNGCAKEFALVSGDITQTGVEGLRGGMKVFQNDMNYPLNDGMTVDIDLSPCYFEDAGSPGVQIYPGWYVVP